MEIICSETAQVTTERCTGFVRSSVLIVRVSNLRGCAERKTFVGSSVHLVILSLCSASGLVRAEDICWMLCAVCFSVKAK